MYLVRNYLKFKKIYFLGSQQAKDEMKRCRIRACLYQDETDNMKIAEAYSISICDTKNKSYGNFEISTMSKPWGCCSKGGWQTFLVSKTKVLIYHFYL